MYKYYCKDSQCQGHTKSWERCCDMRAFSMRETTKTNQYQATPTCNSTKATMTPMRKPIFT